MSDLIERQAAIDALRVAYWDENIQSAKDDPCIVDAMTDWAIRQIKALPSAQPEIKCIAKVTLTDEQVKEAFEKAKDAILTAQPERKKGEVDTGKRQ